MRSELEDTYQQAGRQVSRARGVRIRQFWDAGDLLGAAVAARLTRR
jgi:hypothetical protein